ncbi:MAG TPA: F0F1 ATP synthase subunit B [Bacilli bacterium]|nr:F0F1 ATP synthase subunit B [Bacilli bacterium]
MWIFSSGSPFNADDFYRKLIPENIWSLVTQLLAFGVLVIIVVKLVYKPVRKMLITRADYIEKNIKDAESQKKEMEDKLAAADALVLEERKKAVNLVMEAKAQTEVAREKMMAEAKEAARQEKQKALEEINQARQEAEAAIHDEIVNVALLASKEVLGREINETDNRRLVDDFIKDIKN